MRLRLHARGPSAFSILPLGKQLPATATTCRATCRFCHGAQTNVAMSVKPCARQAKPGGLARPRGKHAPGAARAPRIGKIPQRDVRLVWLTNRRPETAGKRRRQLPPRCTERLNLRLSSGRRTEPRGQRRRAPDDEVPKLKRESPRLARQCRRREMTNEGGRLSSRPLARWLLPA